MKQHNNKNGFTLIELLILITIVGILLSNLVPRLFKNPDRQIKNNHKAQRQLINSQLDIYYIQNKTYPVEGTLVEWTDYVTDYFPKGAPDTCNAGEKWVITRGKVNLTNHEEHE